MNEHRILSILSNYTSQSWTAMAALDIVEYFKQCLKESTLEAARNSTCKCSCGNKQAAKLGVTMLDENGKPKSV